jgi:hypothetical protein
MRLRSRRGRQARAGRSAPCGDDDRRFLRQVDDGFKQFRRQVVLEATHMREAIPVAHQQENELALVRAVIHPTLEGDFLIHIVTDLRNANDGGHKFLLIECAEEVKSNA